MPIKNGVGFSEVTAIKQKHFREIVRTSLTVTKAILAKRKLPPNFYYTDLNAGPGFVEKVGGSPVIFCGIAKNFPRLRKYALLCEMHEENARILRDVMSQYKDRADFRIKVLEGDHTIELGRELDAMGTESLWRYGLVYNDPSGGLPSFELLQRYARHFPPMDILIHCSATNCKRFRKAKHVARVDRRLDEYLAQIGKKFWFVREPYYRHQWTFLLGTNWDAFPRFHKIGFHRVDSDRGRDILKKLCLTKEELEALQEE